MEGASVAAQLPRLSRAAMGSKTVRAARALFSCPADFVLLDADRALVVAATDRTALQPRVLRPAEEALRSGTDVERTSDSTAARVSLTSGVMGCLSVPIGLDAVQQEQLKQLAATLGAALAEDTDRAPGASLFESAVLAGLRDCVVVLDPALNMKWCNDGVVPLLGWDPAEVLGRSFVELVHPDDLERAAESIASLTGGHRVYRLNIRVQSAYGDWEHVSITGFDHTDDEMIGGYVASLRSDERELESERALDENRRMSTAILENLHEAVIATDEVGAFTVINGAARRLFSIPMDAPAQAVSLDDIELRDEQDKPLDRFAHPLRPSSNWSDRELRVRHEAGVRHVSVSRNQVDLDSGRRAFVVTFYDITQARSDARELRNRSLYDQLTGLANRRYLSERLKAFENATEDVELAACFVDIDNFKLVNDVHGHRVGDTVLRAVAHRLQSQIRIQDILARPGGDEFLVVLVNPENREAAIDLAERIRTSFDHPFDIDGHRLHLSASVGIAFNETDGSLDDGRLLRHADIALYAAKDAGRDRLEVFDQELATSVEREQEGRNLVRSALSTGDLKMHFQQIVNHRGAVLGVEALARIRKGEALISPAGFMGAIDGTSLMVRLDAAGFEQACQLAATLRAHPQTEHMWVAANFAAVSLAQADFAESVLTTIERNGVDPSALCIEVTETAAFDAGNNTIAALIELYGHGIRIALDDFGTGYSSLSHLRDLPLTSVKIDRSFTSALRRHGAERAITSAVKEIASSLDLNVVAEGVETREDQQAVLDLGVESMQGWLFARAIPAPALLEQLAVPPGTSFIDDPQVIR